MSVVSCKCNFNHTQGLDIIHHYVYRYINEILNLLKPERTCTDLAHSFAFLFDDITLNLPLTGDPHASERIGPSCSRSQVAVTLAQLVAAKNGAEIDQLNTIQDTVLPLVKRYHGREYLFDWMKLQIEEAIYKNQDVTPYPEFIKQQIREGKLELNDAREHTRAYLTSYNKGEAHPPLHFYQKVSKKDKVSDIFSSEDLAKFNKIIQKIQ